MHSAETCCRKGFPGVDTNCIIQKNSIVHQNACPCGFGRNVKEYAGKFFFAGIKNRLNLLTLAKHLKNSHHEQS